MRYLYFILLIILVSCTREDVAKCQLFHATCDAEMAVNVNGDMKFVHDHHHFGGAEGQSTEQAHSGKHAIRLDSTRHFGLTITDTTAAPGDVYHATVWRHSKNNKGVLVVSDPKFNNLYQRQKLPSTTEKEWELLDMYFHVPPHYDGNSLTFYVWSPGKETVYFDDLRIEKIDAREYIIPEAPIMAFELSDSTVKKLEAIRLNAFKKGSLSKVDKCWVDASITINDSTYQARMRLKGDRQIHLLGDKWSYRIELLNDAEWNGMRTFCIQKPETRNFLSEWLFHELLLDHDLLATKYGFVPVSMNGKYIGVHAFQEHFSSHLPSTKNRPEGVVIKFSDNNYWKRILLNQPAPAYLAADIKPYSYEDVVSTPHMLDHFNDAHQKLDSYRCFSENATSGFDIDKMAKYYALSDLADAYHGNHWLNQKFYYNTETHLVEEIGHDGYTTGGDFFWPKASFWGETAPRDTADIDALLVRQFFNDPDFSASYKNHLSFYTSAAFVDQFMASKAEAIRKFTSLIKLDYTDYVYDSTLFETRATWLRDSIQRWSAPRLTAHYSKYDHHYTSCDHDLIKTMALKAYTVSKNDDAKTVRLTNYHCSAVQYVGHTVDQKSFDVAVTDLSELPAFNLQRSFIEVTVPLTADSVIYKADGKRVTAPIFPWSN